VSATDLPEGFTLTQLDDYGRCWYEITHEPCGESHRFTGPTPERVGWYAGSHRCGGDGWQQGEPAYLDERTAAGEAPGPDGTASVRVVTTLDLDVVGTFAATALADGSVRLDVGDELSLIGTIADLLDLGATITSLAHSIAREAGK
jgi:hypothetical protein